MTRFQPAALVLAALTTTAILSGVGALADKEYAQVMAQSTPATTTVAAADARSVQPLAVAGLRAPI
jgi:hypothetical protein